MYGLIFSNYLDKIITMELCSLEEDDYGDMFITQSDNNVIPLVANLDNESQMIGGGADLMELGKAKCNQYSDISDVEDFDIPSSQQRPVVR